MAKEQIPFADPEVISYLEGVWDEPWGDRHQALVFIGSGVDWPSIKSQLDRAQA